MFWVLKRTVSLRGGGGHNLNKIGKGPQGDMLHIKYQDSKPCGFRQEEFFMFSYLAYVNHVTPGAGPFWLQCII